MRRVLVGISGATGAVYGVRLLQVLRQIAGIETHLILSNPGKRTLIVETDFSVAQVEALAHVCHDNRDIGAAPASGSFRSHGMVIAPCSIKTLSDLATCHSDTLMARAGDVMLKERRRLIAVVRETPLHVGHLRLMLALAEMGGIVLPPLPAFYLRPASLADIVDHTVARILDQLDIEHTLVPEWQGTPPVP